MKHCKEHEIQCSHPDSPDGEVLELWAAMVLEVEDYIESPVTESTDAGKESPSGEARLGKAGGTWFGDVLHLLGTRDGAGRPETFVDFGVT